MEFDGKFYLGRVYDLEQAETNAQPLLYDPDDLTTHAVVVGMTGSGKTGLCVDLLEEAALNGYPGLMIDPKGDITNLLLHFPDLLAQDFLPWVNAEQARREDQSLEQAAAQAAARWRQGLAEWDIGPERVRALKNAAHFTVYTPGSEAGIPVSILASLKAPSIPWEENRELLREKISGTVTALLGLVGLQDIDPVRSREHILMANIFEHAWSQGEDLSLSELILRIQSPPFDKLGVFDVDTFFPEKDRFELAMLLNNILAAPAFQSWIEGQPLEIPSLLFGADGRPRHSVFYIAHLNDAERMFFVTLLYSAVEAWMRAQSGTSSLRAIVYFDEIFGYLPPVGNPPSKQPMLRMLKQGRAFGVGQVLVTQNPVDVDYKALSNAGTWFIGKLQTEQDKQRLLDGLEGAMSGNLDRGEYDRLISSLGKRIFLLHNVNAANPEAGGMLFQTRWAMNYLAGPLTRAQIPALNELVDAQAMEESPSSSTVQAQAQGIAASQVAVNPSTPEPESSQLPGSATRPALPSGVAEYFLPNNLTFTESFKAAGQDFPQEAHSLGLIYRPTLLAQAVIRFFKRKYDLDYELVYTALVTDPDRRGIVRWEEYQHPSVNPQALDDQAHPEARFGSLEAPLSDARLVRELQRDFEDWAYQTQSVTVRANEALKIYVGPQVSSSELRRMCSQAARERRDAELRSVSDSYNNKIAGVLKKLAREERELSEDETELSQRKLEEFGTHAENLLSLFGGKSRRRISTSLRKRRMTEQAKADVEESLDTIKEYEQEIEKLEDEKDQALDEVRERWGEIANQITEIPIQPYKKDVFLDLFGVAWFPYYRVQIGDRVVEYPGFSPA
jgi:hypothetical protein